MKTPDRLVAISSNLFFQHGYSAVGLNQILSAAKISKTTFYKYFDSIEEIMVTAIRVEGARWSAKLDDDLAQISGNGRSRLDAVIDSVGEWAADGELCGCPFARAVSEFPDQRDPRYQAAAEVLRRVAEVVEEAANDEGLQQPREFARKIQSVLVGSCVLGGALRDPEQVRRLRDLMSVILTDAKQNETGGPNDRPAKPKTSKPRTDHALVQGDHKAAIIDGTKQMMNDLQ